MNKTTIEWTDFTWNPVTGCDKVSAGCRSCYAETMATRFWGERKFTDVELHFDRLDEPVKMGTKLHGKRVFVCDVSDLFHDRVITEFINSVMDVIAKCPNTLFQILTKRPERMYAYFKHKQVLPNVILGTSCENEDAFNKRSVPVAYLGLIGWKTFLSLEPLIGPINNLCLDGIYKDCIHWIIAGGESGHMARPMHPGWVRSLRDQCKAANVPFFFKQWGEWVDNQNMPREHVAGKYKQHIFGTGVSTVEVWKLGKSKSGNMLDGRTHLEFPLSAIASAKAETSILPASNINGIF